MLCFVIAESEFQSSIFYTIRRKSTRSWAVLAQKNENVEKVPIAYTSHELNYPQRNYSVSEQECLLAFLAIRKCRAYVEAHEYEVLRIMILSSGQ